MKTYFLFTWMILLSVGCFAAGYPPLTTQSLTVTTATSGQSITSANSYQIGISGSAPIIPNLGVAHLSSSNAFGSVVITGSDDAAGNLDLTGTDSNGNGLLIQQNGNTLTTNGNVTVGGTLTAILSGTSTSSFSGGISVLYAIPGKTLGTGTGIFYGDYVPNSGFTDNGHDDTSVLNAALATPNTEVDLQFSGTTPHGVEFTELTFADHSKLISKSAGAVVFHQRANTNLVGVTNLHPWYLNASGITGSSGVSGYLPSVVVNSATTQTIVDTGIEISGIIFDFNGPNQAGAGGAYYVLGPQTVKTIAGVTGSCGPGPLSSVSFQGLGQSYIHDCQFVRGYGFLMVRGNCDQVKFERDIITEPNPNFAPYVPGLTAPLNISNNGNGDGFHDEGGVTNCVTIDCQRLFDTGGSPIDYENGPGDGNALINGILDGSYIVCRSYGPNVNDSWIRCYSNGGAFSRLGETAATVTSGTYISGTTKYTSGSTYVPAISSPVINSLLEDCTIGPGDPWASLQGFGWEIDGFFTDGSPPNHPSRLQNCVINGLTLLPGLARPQYVSVTGSGCVVSGLHVPKFESPNGSVPPGTYQGVVQILGDAYNPLIVNCNAGVMSSTVSATFSFVMDSSSTIAEIAACSGSNYTTIASNPFGGVGGVNLVGCLFTGSSTVQTVNSFPMGGQITDLIYSGTSEALDLGLAGSSQVFIQPDGSIWIGSPLSAYIPNMAGIDIVTNNASVPILGINTSNITETLGQFYQPFAPIGAFPNITFGVTASLGQEGILSYNYAGSNNAGTYVGLSCLQSGFSQGGQSLKIYGSGNTNIGGGVDNGFTLEINGSTKVDSSLTVSNAISAASGTFSGNVTSITGTFSGNGSLLTNIPSSFSGNLTVSGTTTATGPILSGTVVSGTLVSGQATVSNALLAIWPHPIPVDTGTGLTNVGSLVVSVSSTTATIKSTNVLDTSPFDLHIIPKL